MNGEGSAVKKLSATELPLAKVFSDDYVFSIPGYQRPYSWTMEHAGELLEDLLAFMDNYRGYETQLNPYFLGSIVLIKGVAPQAEVVDGQQRLTTLTILLAALRALANPQDKEHLTPFLYERGNPYSGTQNRYRLTLRERDERFFRDYIQAEDGIASLESLKAKLIDSQRNIREVAAMFLLRLGRLPEAQRQKLGQFVLRQCYLVVVSTPDLDSAYRIFSVLNDRGLDLSHADILKAEVIGKVSEEEQDQYTGKWEDTEDDLGRESFRDLFGHIRMIYRKSKPQDTLLKEFRTYVKPTADPTGFVDNTLLPLSSAYSEIIGASYDGDERAKDINDFLRWLSRVDNADWIPPAILYFSLHKNAPDTLTEFLRLLERLAAGLMITRANVNKRIERYARVVTAVEKGEDLFDLNSPLQLRGAECDRVAELLNGDLYNSVRVRLPVLLRLDEALSSGEARYDYRVISVEHVLPQNPPAKSEWTQWFPNEELRGRFVHRIGNLVLLSRKKNSQAQNFEFEVKKKQYFTRGNVSPFALTSEVLHEETWTPETVQRRQEHLILTLKRLWQL